MYPEGQKQPNFVEIEEKNYFDDQETPEDLEEELNDILEEELDNQFMVLAQIQIFNKLEKLTVEYISQKSGIKVDLTNSNSEKKKNTYENGLYSIGQINK